MWLKSELKRLEALYGEIEDTDIETVLNTGDLETIQDLSSTESAAIRNYLFIPKVSLPCNREITFLSIIVHGKRFASPEWLISNSMLAHG